MQNLSGYIRDVPDFPKKGIIFKDITTLLKDGNALRQAVDELCDRVKDIRFERIVSIESRGFIFGSALAYKTGKGLIPVRKKGKLPAETVNVSYELEYGTDILEMHKDAIEDGMKVIIIDDLLATGGTASAVSKLVEQCGGKVEAIGFVIELDFLKGREALADYNVISLIHY